MDGNPGTREHPGFVVEMFVDQLASRNWRDICGEMRAVIESSDRLGSNVRYVRSIVVPDDEVCFHVFEAASADAIEAVLAAGGMRSDRVYPALLVDLPEAPGGMDSELAKEKRQ